MPESTVKLSVHVSPNAPRNEVTGLADGVWKIKIAAPPVDGKANKELFDFLSQKLGVSKSSLALLRGQTGRHKVIGVAGLTQDDIAKRLSPRIS